MPELVEGLCFFLTVAKKMQPPSAELRTGFDKLRDTEIAAATQPQNQPS
jgi:hypothetical protein